jgi:GntR family transcriptional repressor for pyruvate dehydrogenase complex
MSDPLAIVPVRRSRVSQQIVVQLCQMIRQGQLRPGDRLPSERELSEQLQVSRASLREALRALEIAGIVAIKQGGGTYIREVFDDGILSPLSLVLDASTDLVGNLWEVRSIFEPAVASRAAIRAQPEDLASLEHIVEEQRSFLKREMPNEVWLESDRAYHVAVARASRNEVAVRVIRLINELLHDGRRHFATRADRRERAYFWHQEIATRIREGNPLLARDAMLEHLREVEEVIVGEVIAPVVESAAGTNQASSNQHEHPARQDAGEEMRGG